MSNQPQLQPSEEVDEQQLDLAREAGETYRQAVDYMIEEVAHTGGREREGDYVVGFAQEEAEGMYRMTEGDLEWVEPGDDENCHLEVTAAAAADGRFVPGLDVTATLEGEDETIGPEPIPFVWHPGLYHYGANLTIPGDGTYDITIEIAPATFPRHDEQNGDRFAETVVVEFDDVDVQAGTH